MKNTGKLFGIIAAMAAIALSATGCSTDSVQITAVDGRWVGPGGEILSFENGIFETNQPPEAVLAGAIDTRATFIASGGAINMTTTHLRFPSTDWMNRAALRAFWIAENNLTDPEDIAELDAMLDAAFAPMSGTYGLSNGGNALALMLTVGGYTETLNLTRYSTQ